MIHVEMTMRSTVLEMDTKLTVLLPEDRHKTEDLRGKKYPVLYILHGMKEDCSSWVNLSNLFLYCRDLPLIVVCVSANNSSYTNMAYGFDYNTFITQELPMKMKNIFPITDDVEQTFIMGESMGGYGTMLSALTAPEVYGKAVCLSGCDITKLNLFDNKLRKGCFGLNEEETRHGQNSLNDLMDKLAEKDCHKPQFMFYCGTEDLILDGCKQLAGWCKEKLPECFAGEEYWPGEHNFFFWNEAIPKALEWFGFKIPHNSVI